MNLFNFLIKYTRFKSPKTQNIGRLIDCYFLQNVLPSIISYDGNNDQAHA